MTPEESKNYRETEMRRIFAQRAEASSLFVTCDFCENQFHGTPSPEGAATGDFANEAFAAGWTTTLGVSRAWITCPSCKAKHIEEEEKKG